MSNLTDERVEALLRRADRHDAPPPLAAPMIEHHIGGQVNVGETAMPDGQQLKIIVITHPSGHQWIIQLPLAAAQTIGKELTKPPRVPNGIL